MAVFSGLACWCRYSTVNIYAFIWVKLCTDLHLMQLGNQKFLTVGTLDAILYLKN